MIAIIPMLPEERKPVGRMPKWSELIFTFFFTIFALLLSITYNGIDKDLDSHGRSLNELYEQQRALQINLAVLEAKLDYVTNLVTRKRVIIEDEKKD